MENEYKNKILSYASTYNSSLKFLSRIYVLKKKGTFDEEKADRNNRRLAIVVAEEPVWMLQNTGMYLLKHAEKIKNRDWRAIMTMDFEDEKKIYKQTEDGSKAVHTDKAMKGKIDFIRKVFENATDKERNTMMDAVTDMLSVYCQYALLIKNSDP